MIWFTADWHLGEQRLDLLQRPFDGSEEMVETLVANHNKRVAPGDHVYVIGDALYRHAEKQWLRHLLRFNGRLRLLRGNHDRPFSDSDYYMFDEIVPEGEGQVLDLGNGFQVNLVHYPALARSDMFNLTGPRLELFARTRREGWDGWGDEYPS